MNKLQLIFKSLSIVTLATIINASSQFLTIPFLVRSLTVEQYGMVGLYMALTTILQMVISMSAGNYLSVRINKENISTSGVYGILLAFSIFFVFLAVTLFFILNFFKILGFLPEQITFKLITYAGITSFGYVVANTLYSTFIAMQQPLKGLGISVFQSIVPLLLTFAFVVPGAHSDETRMQIVAYSMLFLAIAILVKAFRNMHDDFPAIKERINGLLSFGIRLLPHTLGILLFTSIDKILISKYYGSSGLGSYIFAFQLAAAISLFFEVLNSVYAPLLYKELSSGNPRKYALIRGSYVFFILVLSLFPILYFSSSFVVVLMGGNELMSSDGLFVLISIGSCFTGMYFVVTNYVLFSERGDLLSIISIFTGLMYIFLIYTFKNSEIIYVAISYLFACCMRFLLTFWCANKVYPMPWFSLKGVFNYGK